MRYSAPIDTILRFSDPDLKRKLPTRAMLVLISKLLSVELVRLLGLLVLTGYGLRFQPGTAGAMTLEQGFER